MAESYETSLAAFSRALAGDAIPPLFDGSAAQVAARLGIYRNNIRMVRMAALEGAFPLVRTMVGEAFFTGLTREYAKATPSRDGDLHRYGAHFAEFLRHFTPTRALPYLPDLAHLEWCMHAAYYAADGQAPDLSVLQRVPPDRQGDIRWPLAPATRLLTTEYPVAAIHAYHQRPASDRQGLPITPGRYHALVSRPRHDVSVHTLDDGEEALLRTLAAGETLAHAVDAAGLADAQFDLQAALQRFVAFGALGPVLLPGDPPASAPSG